MFQGPSSTRARNTAPFDFEPRAVDFVVLTHAHLDHSGLLPRLAAHGFSGPIYSTPATRDLLTVLLPDSAHLQQVDADRAARHGREYATAYTLDEVREVLKQVRTLPYDLSVEPAAGVRLCLREAGHILGSSIVELSVADGNVTRKVVVSGDLGQPGRPILRDPAIISEADVLLLESTYGDRDHRSLASTLDELTAILGPALSSGVVLVPAFAVGRTQEFLYHLDRLTREGRLSDLTVFLDSPMAAEVTAITSRHFELFDDEARRLATEAPAPHSPAMHLKVTASVQDSIALNRIESGAIIIAASGMCDGGRIRHHLRHRLSNPHTTVLIVGFQAAGTLGRLLVDGARSVRLFGEDIPVHAHIATLGGFSAHADQSALVEWLSHFRAPPQHLFLVHGEERASTALATRIKDKLGWDARIPADRERVHI